MSARTLTLLARYFISISIHVPRAGYDVAGARQCHGRRTISIHVPRAGYDPSGIPNQVTVTDISIHVPRAGYDVPAIERTRRQMHFYPRTPCGVRPGTVVFVHGGTAFLSTYPVRGTTRCAGQHCSEKEISIHVPRAGYDDRLADHAARQEDFYPRTPCGVRHALICDGSVRSGISIHVPRAGYDAAQTDIVQRLTIFLSTYPVRGTTHSQTGGVDMSDISIHVPRAGYDPHKQKN